MFLVVSRDLCLGYRFFRENDKSASVYSLFSRQRKGSGEKN
jgi:hypothetical protein